MRSMLGRNEEFVLEKLQSLIENEEKVKSQESDINKLENELEKSKQEIHHLMNKLDTKCDVIDDLEYDVDEFEKKYEDAQKNVLLKEKELNELKIFLSEHIEKMNILRDNNQSMVSQIGENLKMEKKIAVQNDVIKQLKENISQMEKDKEDPKNEIEKLMVERDYLEKENFEKMEHLKKFEIESEILRENLIREKDKNQMTGNMENGFDKPSLSEELNLFAKFKCESCDKDFGTKYCLKNHISMKHRELSQRSKLDEKLVSLEKEINEQRFEFLSKLFELKETEENFKCNCKGVCKIRHKFYNWSKPKSSELLNRSRQHSEEHAHVENETLNLLCHSCENEFTSLADLEIHSETVHSEDVLQVCSSNPWGLTFFDI